MFKVDINLHVLFAGRTSTYLDPFVGWVGSDFDDGSNPVPNGKPHLGAVSMGFLNLYRLNPISWVAKEGVFSDIPISNTQSTRDALRACLEKATKTVHLPT